MRWDVNSDSKMATHFRGGAAGGEKERGESFGGVTWCVEITVAKWPWFTCKINRQLRYLPSNVQQIDILYQRPQVDVFARVIVPFDLNVSPSLTHTQTQRTRNNRR